MMSKTCAKCGSDNINRHGQCRACFAAYMRKWSAANKARLREIRLNKSKRPEQKAKKREWDRRYREANKDVLKERRGDFFKQWNADPEVKAAKKAWYEANKARLLAARKVRYNALKNTEAFKKQRADAARKRRLDPIRRVHDRISTRVRQSLKGNKGGRSWEALLGYSLSDLTDRLRGTLPSGFTWEDFLNGRLEIDHIIPISAFRISSADDEEFKRCWGLDNLQLLTPEDNNKKRDFVPDHMGA